MAVPVNIEDLINQRIIESNRIEEKDLSNIPFDDRPNLAADITDLSK